MAESGNASDEGEIILSPSKETYQSVQSDVTPISAVKELIDNSLDNWERVYDRNKPLEIDITYDHDAGVFEIRDNSGGLEEENIHMLFALGESTKDVIDSPIGAFGIGAKKAIVKLGNRAELRSRHKDQEKGFGYSISKGWLDDPYDWRVPKEEYENLEPGETIITISDLKLQFSEALENPEEAESKNVEAFLEKLRDELRNTYELFLNPQRNGLDSPITINLNGSPLTPPDPINWSFTPFDDFHPRRYSNIRIERDDLKFPVYLSITVGLMRKGNMDKAGTDIFCQRRKVVSSDTGVTGGYGSGRNHLGSMSPTRARLKVRVEFETQGNADKLPWNTQKDDVDQYSPIMQEAYDWINRTAKPYWRASYSNMPEPYVSPYGGEYGPEDGRVPDYNYTGRKRVTDKPDDNFTETKELDEIVMNHISLGIKAPNTVRPEYQPAYNNRIDDQSEEVDLIELPDADRSLTESEIEKKVHDVRTLVERDANRGTRLEKSEEWWWPLYVSELKNRISTEFEDLDISEEEPVIPDESDPDETTESGEHTSGYESGPHESEENKQSTETSGEDTQGESKEASQSEEDEDTTTPTTIEEFDDKDRTIIAAEVSDETWEKLCGFFELPVDTSTEKVAERMIAYFKEHVLDLESTSD